MSIEEFIEKMNALIKDRYREYVVYAYLFGSVVEGRATRESDIDVALRFYDHVSDRERFRVFKELLAIIDEDIDLVDLSKASIVLRMDVYSRGRIIYCSDREALFRDQLDTLKKFDDFRFIARWFKKRMVNDIERMFSKEI